MTPERLYALVAYIKDDVGEFVENLRGELHPAHAHLPAHITVLPPRCLAGTEAEALTLIERICQETSPFDVTLGDVENFMPKTATVFIRVAFAAYRLRELHDKLNTEALAYSEQWPYMPHLTVVKVDSLDDAACALEVARQRWGRFESPRKVRIDELTFVKQGEDPNTWIDIAPVPLGDSLVSSH